MAGEELSREDTRVAHQALNEVLHGPDAIEEWEFSSRMGTTRKAASDVLARLADRYRNETMAAEVRPEDALIVDAARSIMQATADSLRAGGAYVELEVSPPDAMATSYLELGGRSTRPTSRWITAIVEVDPGRVGWRLSASLSSLPDGKDVADETKMGERRIRTIEDAESAVRVLSRRVCLEFEHELKR